jgi:hypothetical protein
MSADEAESFFLSKLGEGAPNLEFDIHSNPLRRLRWWGASSRQ